MVSTSLRSSANFSLIVFIFKINNNGLHINLIKGETRINHLRSEASKRAKRVSELSAS